MNNVHMLNAEGITKSSVLTRKSNARLGGPHFGSNSPLYGAKPQSNAGGGAEWAVLELSGCLHLTMTRGLSLLCSYFRFGYLFESFTVSKLKRNNSNHEGLIFF